MLQCDEPEIHVMLQMINSFVCKLLGRFLKAEVLTSGYLTSVDVYDQDNSLPSDRVMIGFLTQSTMNSKDFLPRENILLLSIVGTLCLKLINMRCLAYQYMTQYVY